MKINLNLQFLCFIVTLLFGLGVSLLFAPFSMLYLLLTMLCGTCAVGLLIAIFTRRFRWYNVLAGLLLGAIFPLVFKVSFSPQVWKQYQVWLLAQFAFVFCLTFYAGLILLYKRQNNAANRI